MRVSPVLCTFQLVRHSSRNNHNTLLGVLCVNQLVTRAFFQAEFLRDALYRFLPSVTLERVNRVIKRLQAGKFEGTLGRSTAGPSTVQRYL